MLITYSLSWLNVLPYGLIRSACLDSPSTQNAHDNSDSVQALTALRKDVEFIKGTQKKMDDKMTKIDDGLVGARINIKEIQTTLNESMKKDMQGMQRSMTALTEGITDLKIEIKTKSQWQNLWQSGTRIQTIIRSCTCLLYIISPL